jgi:hypothetical protein
MYFSTKSYLKSNHNHTDKHIISVFIDLNLDGGVHAIEGYCFIAKKIINYVTLMTISTLFVVKRKKNPTLLHVLTRLERITY